MLAAVKQLWSGDFTPILIHHWNPTPQPHVNEGLFNLYLDSHWMHRRIMLHSFLSLRPQGRQIYLTHMFSIWLVLRRSWSILYCQWLSICGWYLLFYISFFCSVVVVFCLLSQLAHPFNHGPKFSIFVLSSPLMLA